MKQVITIVELNWWRTAAPQRQNQKWTNSQRVWPRQPGGVAPLRVEFKPGRWKPHLHWAQLHWWPQSQLHGLFRVPLTSEYAESITPMAIVRAALLGRLGSVFLCSVQLKSLSPFSFCLNSASVSLLFPLCAPICFYVLPFLCVHPHTDEQVLLHVGVASS